MLLIPKYDGDLFDLITKFGGLYSNLGKITVYSLYRTVLESLKSLVKLKTARLLHMDIRFPNIIYKIDDKKIDFQIIDFDLVRRYSEISYGEWLEKIRRNSNHFSFDFSYLLDSKITMENLKDYLNEKLLIVDEPIRTEIINEILMEINEETINKTMELFNKDVMKSFSIIFGSNDENQFGLIIYTLIWITLNNISKKIYELSFERFLEEETEEIINYRDSIIKLTPLLKTMEELFTFNIHKRKPLEIVIRNIEEQLEILEMKRDELI